MPWHGESKRGFAHVTSLMPRAAAHDGGSGRGDTVLCPSRAGAERYTICASRSSTSSVGRDFQAKNFVHDTTLALAPNGVEPAPPSQRAGQRRRDGGGSASQQPHRRGPHHLGPWIAASRDGRRETRNCLTHHPDLRRATPRPSWADTQTCAGAILQTSARAWVGEGVMVIGRQTSAQPCLTRRAVTSRSWHGVQSTASRHHVLTCWEVHGVTSWLL
jgi:hypothetical protein